MPAAAGEWDEHCCARASAARRSGRMFPPLHPVGSAVAALSGGRGTSTHFTTGAS